MTDIRQERQMCQQWWHNTPGKHPGLFQQINGDPEMFVKLKWERAGGTGWEAAAGSRAFLGKTLCHPRLFSETYLRSSLVRCLVPGGGCLVRKKEKERREVFHK